MTSEKDEEHNLNKIEDDCEVTLALKLANPSKETVIEYIHLLEERNDVYFAEPNPAKPLRV